MVFSFTFNPPLRNATVQIRVSERKKFTHCKLKKSLVNLANERRICRRMSTAESSFGTFLAERKVREIFWEKESGEMNFLLPSKVQELK